MADQILWMQQRSLSNDAEPLVAPGAKLYLYQTGTTTFVDTYSDASLSTPNQKPLVADTIGRFPIAFYGGTAQVKAVLTAADETTLYTIDPAPRWSSTTSAASGISYVPGTYNDATNVQDAIDLLSDALSGSTSALPVVGGTADAVTLTTAYGYTTLPRGLDLWVRFTSANTGAMTINIDGIGAVAVRTVRATATPAGYVRTDADTRVSYDGTYLILDRKPEYGTGLSGDWVRYADGFQRCNHSYTTTAVNNAAGSNFRSTSQDWTFPKAFIAKPVLGANVDATYMWWGRGTTSLSTTLCSFAALSSVTAGAGVDIYIQSEGRWY